MPSDMEPADVVARPKQPKQPTNQSGDPRVVGVEMEFGGLDLDILSTRIQGLVGGSIEWKSRYEVALNNTRIGDIRMVLDAVLFRDFKLRGFLDKLPLEKLKPNLSESIETLLATEAHEVDPTRSLSTFIDPFPNQYALQVLDFDYAPELPALIEDYLAANPTCSRPLDLLPVLAWLDEARIRARLPEEKISKRPAFHYRLPNCRIDEVNWSITSEWNIWMRVEDLADDETALRDACQARARQLRSPLQRLVNWIQPS